MSTNIVEKIYNTCGSAFIKNIGFLSLKIFIQVMVDKTDVIYDDVRFIEPVSRTLAIANTGQVNKFRFWTHALCILIKEKASLHDPRCP